MSSQLPVPGFSGGEVIGLVGRILRLLLGPFPKIITTAPSCAEPISITFGDGWYPAFRLRIELSARGFLSAPCEVKVVRVSRNSKLLDDDPSLMTWTHQQTSPFGTKMLHPGAQGKLLAEICGSDEKTRLFTVPSEKALTGGHSWSEPGLYRIDVWVHIESLWQSRFVSFFVTFDPAAYDRMKFERVVIRRSLKRLDAAAGPISRKRDKLSGTHPSVLRPPSAPTAAEWRRIEQDFAAINDEHLEADSLRESGAEQPHQWRIRSALRDAKQTAIDRFEAVARLAGQSLRRIDGFATDHPGVAAADDRDSWLNALARFTGAKDMGHTTTREDQGTRVIYSRTIENLVATSRTLCLQCVSGLAKHKNDVIFDFSLDRTTASIGDKVPTLFNSSQAAVTNIEIFPIESRALRATFAPVNYLEPGQTLSVKPNVYHQGESGPPAVMLNGLYYVITGDPQGADENLFIHELPVRISYVLSGKRYLAEARIVWDRIHKTACTRQVLD